MSSHAALGVVRAGVAVLKGIKAQAVEHMHTYLTKALAFVSTASRQVKSTWESISKTLM